MHRIFHTERIHATGIAFRDHRNYNLGYMAGYRAFAILFPLRTGRDGLNPTVPRRSRSSSGRKASEGEIALHLCQCLSAHRLPQRVIAQQARQAVHKLADISVTDQIAVHAVIDNVGRAAVVAADHWLAASHGFDKHEAKAFAAAGHGENRAMAVGAGKLIVRYERQEMNALGSSRFSRERLQAGQIASFSYRDQVKVRKSFCQSRHRRDQVIGAFISFTGVPTANCQDHPSLWKAVRQRGTGWTIEALDRSPGRGSRQASALCRGICAVLAWLAKAYLRWAPKCGRRIAATSAGLPATASTLQLRGPQPRCAFREPTTSSRRPRAPGLDAAPARWRAAGGRGRTLLK